MNDNKGLAMPGPWSASEMTMGKKLWASLNNGDALHIVQANWDGWTGDVVACVWADDDHDEAETARLIAAAPDMAEALEVLADAVSRYRTVGPLKGVRIDLARGLDLAEAALAKAKGKRK